MFTKTGIMDVQDEIFLFQKEFKTYDDLKHLGLCACSLVEPDSALISYRRLTLIK